MQIKFYFIVIYLVALPCWAQKGGTYGNLVNQNRSPARQIQAARTFPTGSVSQETQSQEQQQYEDEQQAALGAPSRERPTEEDEESNPAPEPYSFSYAVNDEENGSEISREESQDAAGNVIGFYQMRDNEGRMRRVDYTAGPEGFRATIRSNEEGLANRDAADAKYEVDEVLPERQAAVAAAFRSHAPNGPSAGYSKTSSAKDNISSFGDDQSSYTYTTGERHQPSAFDSSNESGSHYKTTSEHPVKQIQQENIQEQLDFEEPQKISSPVFSRFTSGSQQLAKRPVLKSRPPMLPAAPAPFIQRPKSSIGKQPPSLSKTRRPQASISSSFQKPIFDQQQKNDDVYSSQNDNRALFSSHSPPGFLSRPRIPSRSGMTQNQSVEQQRVQQEYDDQEVLQQQQTKQQTKRWALPLNFFLPQAFRS